MGPRLPTAPRWAWIVIVFCAVAVALALPRILDTRSATSPTTPDTAVPASTSASASPSASTSPSPDDGEVRMLVVGDAWTAGTEAGGNGLANWTAVLGAALREHDRAARITVAAAVGAGYLQEDPEGRTFADLAREAAVDRPDLVLFFGSESDVATPAEERDAAARTFARARQAWPEAELRAVGPAWAGDAPPPGIVSNGSAVGQAAATAGVPYVDPVAEGWFADAGPAVVAGPGGYPTDAGHRVIARKMAEFLDRTWGADLGG